MGEGWPKGVNHTLLTVELLHAKAYKIVACKFTDLKCSDIFFFWKFST